MYSERPSTIPGAVLWRTTSTGRSGPVLPDGCMDLIWMNHDVMVAGPDTRPYTHTGTPARHYVGLRFAPGALPALLGVAAADLRDSRVPLRDLAAGGTRSVVDRLLDQLAGQLAARPPEADDAGRILESFPDAYAAARSGTRTIVSRPSSVAATEGGEIAGAPGRLAAQIAHLLEKGMSVSEVAERTNLGTRQLRRLSLERFGYGPKSLASILRFQRALRLIPVEPSVGLLALRAGYADQAHLIRETRRLAGTTFGSLVRR